MSGVSDVMDEVMGRRRLTPGETLLARSVFNFGLNPDLVRVYKYSYVPLQGEHTAMTPNGSIYFNHSDYKDDFSLFTEDAAWLVHELTHAWQFQTGRSVQARGLMEQLSRLRGVDPYRYGRIDRKRPFSTYKNEQQAAMTEDYYRLKHHMHLLHGSGSLEDYEAAIPYVPKTVLPQRIAHA